MSGFIVYQDSYIGATIVSNRFIDEYMTDANDAQLKVYLYLVRMLNAHLETSVSDIADRFNHTEKDVLRAFTYWEKKGLLTLDKDETGEVCGIHLVNLCRGEVAGPTVEETHKKIRVSGKNVQEQPSRENAKASESAKAQEPVQSSESAKASEAVQISEPVKPSEFAQVSEPAQVQEPAKISESGDSLENGRDFSDSVIIPAEEQTVSPKPEYSAAKLREFGKKQGCTIMSLAETYFGRPLSMGDIQSLCYMMDGLGMSEELVDYLLMYCTDKGKKDFRYAEKIAVAWKERNITTVDEASRNSLKYDRSVYTIMNRLGKNSSPTDKEMEFILRWTGEYGFGEDMILEACDRTVMATDSHRFQYAEGILVSWYRNNIRTKAEIDSSDEQYQKKLNSEKNSYQGNSFGKNKNSGSAGEGNGGSTARISGTRGGSGSFGKFQQNDMDYAAIISKKFMN